MRDFMLAMPCLVDCTHLVHIATLQSRIDQADAQSGEAFTQPCCIRPRQAYRQCRDEWELQTPELMDLFAKVPSLPEGITC